MRCHVLMGKKHIKKCIMQKSVQYCKVQCRSHCSEETIMGCWIILYLKQLSEAMLSQQIQHSCQYNKMFRLSLCYSDWLHSIPEWNAASSLQSSSERKYVESRVNTSCPRAAPTNCTSSAHSLTSQMCDRAWRPEVLFEELHLKHIQTMLKITPWVAQWQR